jgi:hypothetical protein
MIMTPTQLIAEWLTKIGLERCAAAFAIDVSVLGHLTDTNSEKDESVARVSAKDVGGAPASRTWKVRLARCTGPNMNGAGRAGFGTLHRLRLNGLCLTRYDVLSWPWGRQ